MSGSSFTKHCFAGLRISIGCRLRRRVGQSAIRLWTVWVVLAAGTAAALPAQSRAVVLMGYGGLHLPLSDLAPNGENFGTAVGGGGGIAVQVGPNAAFRGTVTLLKSELHRADGSSEPNLDVRRLLLAGDVQIGLPNGSGFVPYLVIGLGRLSFDPDQSGTGTFGRLAGRLGTGINVLTENSLMALFFELTGWFYRFDGLGFDRFQSDLMLAGGVSYALPF